MKKIILLSLLALIVSACAVERRAITARLHTDKIFYAAYMEWQESIFGISDYCSKIKRCNFMDNNGMVCMDEQEAERILNPQKY
ncbi:MAG TPA: hypothetical protein PKH10_09580, partial [bacterium]|nr:hypothetical protein [bacterium]